MSEEETHELEKMAYASAIKQDRAKEWVKRYMSADYEEMGREVIEGVIYRLVIHQ